MLALAGDFTHDVCKGSKMLMINLLKELVVLGSESALVD